MRVSVASVLLFLMVASASMAQAQSNPTFAPGYVVVTPGDTLRGELAELPDIVASREAHFRISPDQEVTVLTVLEIDEYGFDSGRRFLRRSLTPSDRLRPKTFFLQVLVEGRLSLYSYAFRVPDMHGTELLEDTDTYDRFAVEDENGSVHALYRLRWQQRGGEMHVRVDRRFERTLQLLYSDCPAEQARVRRLRFNRSDIVASVTRYNACTGSEAFTFDRDITRRRADVSLGYGVRVGASRATVRSAAGSGPARITPYVGLSGEIRLDVARIPTAFVLETTYQRKGAGEGPVLHPFPSEYYDRDILGMNLGIRLAMRRPIAPYLAGGVSWGWLLNQPERYQPDSGGSIFIPRSHRTYRAEMGAYAEAGVHLPYQGPGTLQAGLRMESAGLYQGMAFGRLFTDLFGMTVQPDHRNVTFSVVAGLRF